MAVRERTAGLHAIGEVASATLRRVRRQLTAIRHDATVSFGPSAALHTRTRCACACAGREAE
jgi:hypothetical protein